MKPDDDFVRRIGERDEEAFVELIENSVGDMQRKCICLCGDLFRIRREIMFASLSVPLDGTKIQS